MLCDKSNTNRQTCVLLVADLHCNYLGNLGSGDEFSDEAFDEVFSTFDKDGSGTVEKPEMVVFIKQLLGGN